MINQYPTWKNVLIGLVFVVGAFYAVPNLFGEDPAIQISALRDGIVDEALQQRLTSHLRNLDLSPIRSDLSDRLLLRFVDTETQLRALDAVRTELGRQYVAALNLAPAAPAWFSSVGAQPMYLGLDLRGGVHFLMEVDMQGAIKQSEQRFAGDIRVGLRNAKIRYRSIVRRDRGSIAIRLRDVDSLKRAQEHIRRNYPELVIEVIDAAAAPQLRASLSEDAAKEVQRSALQQNITTLRNRVNELGVAEPLVQQQGHNRIVIQLPGVQDTARAKEILGTTATLEFRLVDDAHSVSDALAGRIPATSKLYRDRNDNPYLLHRDVMLTGEYITDAASGIDSQSGGPTVFITLDGKGARIFSSRTRDRIGKRLSVVFIENKSETRIIDGETIKNRWTVEEIINVAVIRDQLSKRFQITGLDSSEEARDLALLLRAGSLAAPIEIVEERTIGPSLGRENIDQGLISVVIGLVLVLALMAVYYRGFGLVANAALVMNLLLLVAILSMLQATLTLPGIAGIVLTVGMAVDANVLIFERIREELRNGNTPQNSIHVGYAKAVSTIADSNITTLIASVVLFGFGTGPIKGFAITLSLGILTSMFTSIMGTRAVINLLYGGRRLQRLPI